MNSAFFPCVLFGRSKDEGLGHAFDVAAGVATTIVYGLAFFGKHRGGESHGTGSKLPERAKKNGNFRGTSCQWDDKKGKILGNQPDFPYEIEWIFL